MYLSVSFIHGIVREILPGFSVKSISISHLKIVSSNSVYTNCSFGHIGSLNYRTIFKPSDDIFQCFISINR